MENNYRGTGMSKEALKTYLRNQINKIRQILELRKLQTLCRLRIIAQKLFPMIDYETIQEGLSIDSKIKYLLESISWGVSCLLHDNSLGWETARKLAGVA